MLGSWAMLLLTVSYELQKRPSHVDWPRQNENKCSLGKISVWTLKAKTLGIASISVGIYLADFAYEIIDSTSTENEKESWRLNYT